MNKCTRCKKESNPEQMVLNYCEGCYEYLDHLAELGVSSIQLEHSTVFKFPFNSVKAISDKLAVTGYKVTRYITDNYLGRMVVIVSLTNGGILFRLPIIKITKVSGEVIHDVLLPDSTDLILHDNERLLDEVTVLELGLDLNTPLNGL